MKSIRLYRDPIGQLALVPEDGKGEIFYWVNPEKHIDEECRALAQGALEHQRETTLSAKDFQDGSEWIATWRTPGHWRVQPNVKLSSPVLGSVEAYLSDASDDE